MHDFTFTTQDGTLFVEGEITDEIAVPFRDALIQQARSLSAPARIDMLDLDLEDGVSVAESVNAIRGILSFHDRLQLHHAPQMFAHTLYKVGMLERGMLTLIAPRIEHPTVA